MEKIITTLSAYPGKKIVKVFEIVWAYDEDFRIVRNRWNLDVPIQEALDRLYEKATKLGANALLGVQITRLPNDIPFVLGTPVLLEDE